jgi:hypothetical protein
MKVLVNIRLDLPLTFVREIREGSISSTAVLLCIRGLPKPTLGGYAWVDGSALFLAGMIPQLN